MADDVHRYQGREQSFIKHEFLTRYLEEAAFKTMQGRSRTFNFVDAFAGPWQVDDLESFSDASFDQALHTLEAVRVHLARMGMSGLHIRFFLCETRSEAVAELRRYAQQKKAFKIQVFHGAFEDHLAEIAAACGDGFTFTFIDPTGWSIRFEPILEFLRKRNGEFLLNFMAEHVNRHAKYPRISASIGRFLADPDWEGEFYSLSSNLSNEERILSLLKRRIKEKGAATYVPDLPILKPLEERVKMRLVLGTHSLKGLEVFRNVQETVERKEIETRNNLRESKMRQSTLFPDDMVVAMTQDLAGVGCSRYREEAKNFVKTLLSGERYVEFRNIWPAVMEEMPMRRPHINRLVNEMKSQGIVAFELPPRRRIPQPETRISLVGANL